MKDTLENGRCVCCGRHAPSPVSSDAQNALTPGTTLDHGNIIVGNPLGHGGFGITYIARDSTFGLIALKEFYSRSFAKREGTAVIVAEGEMEKYNRFMADFKREVKHLLNLQSHPNIVKVLFDFDENNTYYYGMELLQGESLRMYIQRQNQLDPRTALALLDPICSALDYAHQRHTLHRDIAPDNIFLRRNPTNPSQPFPCLIDFGAAFTDKDGFTFVAPSVKKSGFSPPDQSLPYAQQGPFIDVYALTATYYAMVTGAVPPPSMDRQFIQMRAASSLNPAVSRELDAVILKGMELNHERRYQSIAALQQALHQVLDRGRPSSSQVTAQLQCKKGPMQGRQFLLKEKKTLIGREGTLQIVEGDRIASRKHCEIFQENGAWYLVDLKSHNGTKVNLTFVQPYKPVQLSSGDTILIGLEEFTFIHS